MIAAEAQRFGIGLRDLSDASADGCAAGFSVLREIGEVLRRDHVPKINARKTVGARCVGIEKRSDDRRRQCGPSRMRRAGVPRKTEQCDGQGNLQKAISQTLPVALEFVNPLVFDWQPGDAAHHFL